jgi:hypothetical protein
MSCGELGGIYLSNCPTEIKPSEIRIKAKPAKPIEGYWVLTRKKNGRRRRRYRYVVKIVR